MRRPASELRLLPVAADPASTRMVEDQLVAVATGCRGGEGLFKSYIKSSEPRSTERSHLDFKEVRMVEPFFRTLRARSPHIRLGLLSSLYMTSRTWGQGDKIYDCDGLLCGAVRAGQLLALQELHLHDIDGVVESAGRGACPRLEKLSVPWSTGIILTEIGAAFEARARAACCVSLKSVRVALPEESRRGYEQQRQQQVVEAVMRGLAPWHGSLEELELTWICPEYIKLVTAPFGSLDWASIQSLTLGIFGSPDGDSLRHALARAAIPSLTSLDVSECNYSDDAWRELEAMGPEGECLRRLKALKLVQMFRSPAQLELFTRAVGEGHGCPQLESLSMALDLQEVEDGNLIPDEEKAPWGCAISHAVRPPQGLPHLRRLQLVLTRLWDLDELAEWLPSRPHALQPIGSLILRSCEFESSESERLGRATVEGAPLGGLKELVIEPQEDRRYEEDDGFGDSAELVEVLASGSGRQLERIEWHSSATPEAVKRLLQALVTQAACCPRLRSLSVTVCNRYCRVPKDALDMVAIAVILTGRAACSATLKELRLHADSADPGLLEACLCHPDTTELEALVLGHVGERGRERDHQGAGCAERQGAGQQAPRCLNLWGDPEAARAD